MLGADDWNGDFPFFFLLLASPRPHGSHLDLRDEMGMDPMWLADQGMWGPPFGMQIGVIRGLPIPQNGLVNGWRGDVT